jgi:serine/threonine protein kinase
VHSNNIVHGDLTGVSTIDTSFVKAIIDVTQNNILIDENDTAFVADHGILILCAEIHGTSYIRSNVRWAAPENFQVPEDDESISKPQLASDIYSFGCIMFQVCGQILAPYNVNHSRRRSSQEKFRIPNFEVTIKLPCRYSEVGSLLDQ